MSSEFLLNNQRCLETQHFQKEGRKRSDEALAVSHTAVGGSLRISAISTLPDPIRWKKRFWRDLLLLNIRKSESVTPSGTVRAPDGSKLSRTILNLSPSTFPLSHVKSQTRQLPVTQKNWMGIH